jgi:hypothetical protein
MAPFGVYGDRGPKVQQQLDEWGVEIFRAVFGAGPSRDSYLRMRDLPGTKLVIRSSSASLLGLPWELMRDPDRPTRLALGMAGMSRSLATLDFSETVQVSGARLRVLMVISRPVGRRGCRLSDDCPSAA